jgi:anti-sigma B factor antagonist
MGMRGGSQNAWMRCTIDARGPVIVVRVGGELTARYASMLEVALNWRGDGYKPVVLDCSTLANIDRDAANALVRIYAESKALEIPFVLVAPPRSIRTTMFDLLGLRRVLPIFATLDGAVRHLNGNVPDAPAASGERDGSRFECALREWHGVSVVTVRGDFDLSTARHIREACLRADTLPLVINLASIKYIDSSGVQTLVEIQQQCDARGTGFALAFTSKFLRHLFSVLALDRELRVFPTVDAAVAYLTGHAAPAAGGTMVTESQ